jgi:very-short-patch-repair endonuclease
VDVAQALLEAGGIASTQVLLSVVSRHELRSAVESGSVVRIGRGRYSLADVDEHRTAAVALAGARCLLSAARHWEWSVTLPPERPQIVVPRGRKVANSRRAGIDLRWGEVTPRELAEGVTSKVRTVLDCARRLPLDAALAVLDSALRDGMSKTELLLACARLPRTGRARAFKVVELGDRRAANAFESVLRAVLEDVADAHFEPQVWVGNIGRADLVDRMHRVVVEGDSFEFHSDSASLNRDMLRYNAFLGEGHVVLRFGWRHAMFEQDYVRATVRAVLAPQGRSVRWCPRCDAA